MPQANLPIHDPMDWEESTDIDGGVQDMDWSYGDDDVIMYCAVTGLPILYGR